MSAPARIRLIYGQVYPVVGAVCLGGTWMTLFGFKYFMGHTDVAFDKVRETASAHTRALEY